MKKNEIPGHLSEEAGHLWESIVSDYGVGDDAGRLLLTSALESFDRLREAQAVIDTEGLTVKDKFGQDKVHPLLAVERDSRSAMLRSLKALNLDIEPLHPGPGRPGGK